MSFDLLIHKPRFLNGSQYCGMFSVQFFAIFALLTFLLSAPAPAVGQVLLGDQGIENSGDGSSAGMAEAFQVTASTSGTLGYLTAYLDSSSRSRQIFIGLYANAAGHPGALLAQGNSLAPRAGTWNTVSI